jgi:2,3-bisphosphoglycerate-independent phosphoglycerate mutase
MAEPRPAPRRPVLLIIMDGVGVNPSKANNAVAEANTPRLDEYLSTHSHTTLDASGRSVGLPAGQMGNSEVGHLTLGAGTVVRQDLVRIDDAIEDGSFFDNDALLGAARNARARNEPLHLIGLVSDGGVHSHLRHLLALVEICRREEVAPIVHMITDGRDTAPRSAMNYLPELEERLAEAGGRIATVCGRYYAMDRDKRWERTERAFRAIAFAEGDPAESARAAIESAYAAGETDEFIKPRIVGEPVPLGHDAVCVLFNFRNDRPRQLTAALGMENCAGFDRGDFHPVSTTCLTEYEPRFLSPIAFPPERPGTTLAGTIAAAGIPQFHCAETEKYAHVTFFFNGGREEPFAGEDRVMVPSPAVDTYDQQPEMSAHEVADETIQAMAAGRYGFILVNFANGDMVGPHRDARAADQGGGDAGHGGRPGAGRREAVRLLGDPDRRSRQLRRIHRSGDARTAHPAHDLPGDVHGERQRPLAPDHRRRPVRHRPHRARADGRTPAQGDDRPHPAAGGSPRRRLRGSPRGASSRT